MIFHSNVDESIDYIRTKKEDTQGLLEEFLINIYKKPTQRRYLKFCYDLLYILHSISPKCYCTIHQAVPLPNERNIEKKFRK